MSHLDLPVPTNIASGISRIQRSGFDVRPRAWPAPPEMPVDYGFLRVDSLAVEGSANPSAIDLRFATAAFLRGLAGLNAQWAFALVGEPDRIGVYWGVSGTADALARQFRNRYAAAFPGSRIDDAVIGGTEFSGHLSGLTQVARVSGNSISLPAPDPTNSTAGRTVEGGEWSGLEALVRSMAGHAWTWLVCGQPVPEPEIEFRLREFREEQRELRSGYLRPGTVEEENHPEARRYAELLEKAIGNHENGLREGLWKTSGYLFADRPAALEAGAMALQGVLADPAGGPEPVRILPCSSPSHRGGDLMEGSTNLTSSETASLVAPPAEDFAGFEIRRVERFRPAPPRIDLGSRVAIGTIQGFSSSPGHWFEVALRQLAGHSLVGGITGSGKTTTVRFLLRQLWQEHRIPWLVIEPSVKCEYRQMLRSRFGDELRVYTAANEPVAPLRLNPLSVPVGIPVQQHIDSLCALFCAAFSWVTPMPYVLSAAMHWLFEEFGWDLVTGIHPDPSSAASHPTLSDLIPVVEQVTRECGYDREITANVSAGIRTRLSSLTRGGKGRMLDDRSVDPIPGLLDRPTVIELSAIGDEDEKAFMMGVLILKIAQHRQAEGAGTGDLRHVLVLEEAHRLLSAPSSSGGFEAAEARAKTTELFGNLMAEIRAFGQGLIAVDQIPGKLASEVIRNTNLKVIHRLPAADDREAVGRAMALNENQIGELARLPCGEAVVHGSGPEEASRVRVPGKGDRELPADDPVTSDEVRRRMEPRIQGSSPPENTSARSRATRCDDRDLPRCPGCDNGNCGYRQTALKALAAENRSVAFRAAMENGWEALWEFGTDVARSSVNSNPTEAMSPEVPWCVLMNLAGLSGWDSESVERLKRNLRILIDRKNSPADR